VNPGLQRRCDPSRRCVQIKGLLLLMTIVAVVVVALLETIKRFWRERLVG
jgi:hypothetical protein